MIGRRNKSTRAASTVVLALALLAAGCTARAEASADGAAERSLRSSQVFTGVPDKSATATSGLIRVGTDSGLLLSAAGETDVGYDDGTLFVEAGEPGSLRLVDNPGGITVGRRVRCSWHALTGPVFAPTWDRNLPVIPEPGWVYVLRCIYPDDGSNLAGYPDLVVFDPGDPVSGPAVGVTEVGRFAVDSIMFETPIPVLSPPARQIVGVPTWLGVTSRLNYRDVAAQAGNTWVKVRPVVRDATWNLGDGTIVRCRNDIDKIWDPAISPASQSTTCSHNFERVSGPVPLAGDVTVSWTIYEITDSHPNTWTIWGVVERVSPVEFDVGELQSVIR